MAKTKYNSRRPIRQYKFIQRPCRVNDLTGRKFGRLTVTGVLGIYRRHTYFRCECECGNLTDTTSDALQKGAVKSCGCLWREIMTKHGSSRTPEYKIWVGMKARCLNPKEKAYEHYGGRGITICDRWKSSFKHFLEDMGSRPFARHEIERIDNNGNYENGNCCWATRKEQNNNKRNTKVITIEDRTMSTTQWSAETGLSRGTIKSRIRSGRSGLSIISKPKRQKSL